MTESNDQLREVVRQKYAGIVKSSLSGCSTSCCGSSEQAEADFNMIGDAYDGISGYVADADLGLGCGLPVEHAGLKSGQTVLDLGSGAGLDAFVARNEVGERGHVIGVDMTAEMIARARENAKKSSFDNVEFRLGEIEHLPVLSDSIEGIAEAYAGCVSGAIPKEDYLELIQAAGFSHVDVAIERRIHVPAELIAGSLTSDQREEAIKDDLHVMSVTVTAIKL